MLDRLRRLRRDHADDTAASRLRAASLTVMLAVAAVLPGGASHAQSTVGAGATWTTPAGTVQGTRYSTLTDITTANAGTLVQEYSVQTGHIGSHEGQPLVVGTVMYVVTPFPNQLMALDLANGGKVLWTYTPTVSSYAQGVACCDVVNRGAAYGNGQIVFALLDNTVIAVNATTGKLTWRKSLGDPHTGMTMSGAPLIVGTKVIVGNSGGEMGIRGWVTALDLATGGLVWQAYNTGSDADVKIGAGFHAFYPKDQGTNLGATSWPTTLWQQGGATVWSWITYDPELNLVFYGTSNPGVWDQDMRPGDNKWSATVFARNPDTGAAVWAYQLTPHDGWDFDAISENIAVDIPYNGDPAHKVLVQFDKNGYAYTWDRATGQILVAQPFETVNWSTGIDLTTGLPAVDPTKLTHEGVWTNNICPTPLGGKDYEPASFSPKTNLFYVPAINLCFNYQALRAQYIKSTPFMGSDATFSPGAGGNMGELFAWNAATGTKAWSVKEPLPLYGGTLATAGNVVFYGTLDKWFKAVDATTGAVLFQTQLECGVGSNPISFTGADGKQRIAVYSGIGWLPGGFAGASCPLESANGVRGGGGGAAAKGSTSGVLHVFKLP